MRPAVGPPTRETFTGEPAPPARAPEVQALVDAALARVHSFASDDVDDSAARVPPALVRELRAAAHPEVQAALMTHARALVLAFGEGCLEGAACAALMRAGFADAAMEALRVNAASAAVVDAGFSALASLSTAIPPDKRLALLRAACESLAGCAAGRGPCALSPRAAAGAATAVNNSILGDETFRQVARSSGAPAALVAALQRHAGAASERLCFVACAAWHGVAGASLQARPPEHVRDAALAAVLAAMRAFPASARVQHKACLALSTLTQHSGEQHAAVRAGAVPLLTAALGAHGADADACEAACFAQSNLLYAFLSSEVPALDAQAALYATVAAMEAHPTHAATQEFGARALGAMSGHTALAPRTASSNALRAVLQAMRAHPEELFVQSACCHALVTMLAPRHRSAALAEGAAPALLHALRASCGRAAEAVAQRADYRQRHEAGPRAYAVAALHQLLATREGAQPLRATGALLAALLALLHGGALGLLQQAPMQQHAAAAVREEDRVQLTKVMCQLAAVHVRECPDCADCAALRARGEMCGRAGCAAAAPASGADEQAPWLRMGRMQKCARCMTAAYCCKAHQTEAWRAHKKACTAAAARREAAAARRAGAPLT